MTMRGTPTGGDGQPVPRHSADVLDAWIRDLVGELQGARAQRLAQLGLQLQTGMLGWDPRALAQALTDTNVAGRNLSFLPLHRRWLARLLGRHRAAYVRFIGAHSRMLEGVVRVRLQAAELAQGQDRHAPEVRHTIDELEAQRRSLNAAIDRAVTWLQDMCAQLADARANGSDDARLETLAESAQMHTQALKRLQAMGTMAHDFALRGSTVLERRAALLHQVRAGMDEFEGNGRQRLDRLVQALRADRNAIPAIPKAIEAHNEFMKRLAASVDACGALKHEERLLAEQVVLLLEQFGDAARPGH